MSSRRPNRWLLALLTSVLAAVGSLLASAPAGAQSDEPPAVLGTLDYENEDEEEVPVEGVTVSATDAAGEEVASVESDADGTFVLELPEPGEYAISIDVETLPEGISLRNEDRATTTLSLSPGQQRNVLFALVEGEGGGGREGPSRLDRVPQLAFEGLKFGLIIAMSAIGLSLIYGTTGLVNFAHGELVTFGALMAYLFNVTFGIHLLLAAPIAVVVSGIAGGLLDRGFWRPLRDRGTSLIALMVVSIGMSLALRHMFLYQFGGRTQPYADYAIQTNTQEIAGVTFVPKDLWIIFGSIILLVLVALALQKTRIGKATRAVSDNRDLAESSGIDVQKVILVVWVVGTALAAVGGVFLGLSEQVSWLGGFQLLLLMFAGVTLGGLGTAYGALVGSIIVGLAVQLSVLFISSELKNVAALLILALILLVRPQGILGRKERVG